MGFGEKAMELTPSEMSLCYCVYAFAEKYDGILPTVAELASNLNVSVPAISRTLKNLEAKEYVQRTVNNTDRRIVHISLTKKGEQCISSHFKAVSEVLDKVLARFTDEELKTMLRLHIKFTSAVSQVLNENKHTI